MQCQQAVIQYLSQLYQLEQKNRLRTAERVEVGNNDGFAGLEAGHDLDGAEAARASFDPAAFGDAVLGDDMGRQRWGRRTWRGRPNGCLYP